MITIIQVLEAELIVMKSELATAEKDLEEFENGFSERDCCQVSGAVEFFQGYVDGLESALKAIKQDEEVDKILVEEE